MGVRIAYDPEVGVACLYCDSSDVAFGPVFYGPYANLEADEFLDWLAGPGADYADDRGIPHRDGDARTFMGHDLARMRGRWENERDTEGERQDEAKARDF